MLHNEKYITDRPAVIHNNDNVVVKHADIHDNKPECRIADIMSPYYNGDRHAGRCHSAAIV